jgi:hypothetical protein
MTIGRHALAAASLLAALAVAGCSDDPEPKFEPDPSPSASSSSAAPGSEPWEKQSQAGAVAFAKHWVDVFNDAQQSGQTADLRGISTEECGSCEGFAGQLEDLYDAGGHLESDGWRVLQSVPTKGTPSDEAIVSLRISRSAQVVHGASGKEKEFSGGRATYSAKLIWEAQAWLMNELELVQ